MCEVCDKQQAPAWQVVGSQSPDAQIIALLTEIRDNTKPQQVSGGADEQAAMNVVRVVAQELIEASNALAACAQQLKEDGKGFRASHAHKAAQRARQAAEGLIGG